MSVLVPLLIGSRGALQTSFVLRLVNANGELETLAEGTMTVTPNPQQADNCTGSDKQCTGTCSDRMIELDWTDAICVSIGVSRGAEARENCRKQDARYGVPQPAQCGVPCGFITCGSTCSCNIISHILLGPYTRNQLSRGTALFFEIDPENQVTEFDESDNSTTFLLSRVNCQ